MIRSLNSLALAGVLLTGSLSAQSTTIFFTAELSEVVVDDFEVFGNLQPGVTTVTGSFTYDPDADPGAPDPLGSRTFTIDALSAQLAGQTLRPQVAIAELVDGMSCEARLAALGVAPDIIAALCSTGGFVQEDDAFTVFGSVPAPIASEFAGGTVRLELRALEDDWAAAGALPRPEQLALELLERATFTVNYAELALGGPGGTGTIGVRSSSARFELRQLMPETPAAAPTLTASAQTPGADTPLMLGIAGGAPDSPARLFLTRFGFEPVLVDLGGMSLDGGGAWASPALLVDPALAGLEIGVTAATLDRSGRIAVTEQVLVRLW